jgi:hypothetical protein
MRGFRPVAPWAMAFALAFVPVGTIGAEDDSDAAAEEPAAEQGFPWLCFTVSVAALGGLYILVRRREREVEADQRRGGKPAAVWYCRACDRDVSGPECPRCRAANPFGHEPVEQPAERKTD